MLKRLLAAAALTAMALALLPGPADAAEGWETPDTVTAVVDGAAMEDRGREAMEDPGREAMEDPGREAMEDPGTRAQTDPSAAALSEPVAAPIPFSMVGFEVPPGATQVDFRTSVDGRAWEPWTSAELPEPDSGPDPGTAEAARQRTNLTDPVWVGEARWMQTRVSGAATAEVDAHVVDSAGLSRNPVERVADALSAAWRGGTGAAHAADAPAIISREQWGADEALRRAEPAYADEVRYGIVHHTAGTNSYAKEESAGIVRGIYSYHTQSRGWNDIGYNFLIDRYGQIFEGRQGGTKKPVIGAHAAGFNSGSVGFSVLGEFSSSAPPDAAREALAQLIAWSFDKHEVDPVDTVKVSAGAGSGRYAEGEQVKLKTITGHHDVGQTSCPGNAFYPLLGELRSRVEQLMDGGGKDDGGEDDGGEDDGGEDDGGGDGGGGDGGGGDRLPAALPLQRLGGATALETAVQVSGAAFPAAASATQAVIARDDHFADAATAGPLAGDRGPVLLTRRDLLPSGTLAELERVLPAGQPVFVLGGPTAISEEVVAALGQRWRVERLYGADRIATAVAVARKVIEQRGQREVLLARAGPDSAVPWADALSGGAYGARSGTPILLTASAQLSPPVEAVLTELGVRTVTVLGGSAAVSDAVAARVAALTGRTPLRVAGTDRAGTAVEVARRLWGRTAGTNGDTVLLSAGYQPNAWKDALVAAPLAARKQTPVLLVDAGALPAATRSYLDSLGYGPGREPVGYVVGGQRAVSDAVSSSVGAILK